MSTAKRLRTEEEDKPEEDDKPGASGQVSDASTKDPVIGLDVCGKVYYCHQSTLVNSSSYFASRFKGNFDASVAYVDERGRSVFFVERLPSLFPYIFEFIISGGCLHLPSFQTDTALIRNLRKEAEFFGLDGLSDLLLVTKMICPNASNQGLLYWLGTKKGSASYQNPFTIGAIGVGGWMMEDDTHETGNMNETARCSRASFVHYQERLPMKNGQATSKSLLLTCHFGGNRDPVVLDLKSILFRPTHYSLRVSTCCGMDGDWDFDGSQDGSHWDTLHAARGDNSLKTRDADFNSILSKKLQRVLPFGHKTEEERSDAWLQILENEFRHTWELNPTPSKLYRYFRIIGAGTCPDGMYAFYQPCSCLHGEGIELFGDVYEE